MGITLTVESMQQIKSAVESGQITIEQVMKQIEFKAEGKPFDKLISEFYDDLYRKVPVENVRPTMTIKEINKLLKQGAICSK